MSVVSRIVRVALVTAAAVAVLTIPPEASARTLKAKKRAAKPQSAPIPALPAGPLPAITLDQMPAIAPQVSYQAGMLSIQAENSTLSDILRAVRSKTGAQMDIPANATERVVGHFGPGPPRDVLASLINGSHFNYVLLGSPNDPAAVSQVILTSRVAGPAGASSGPTNGFQPGGNPNQPAIVPSGQVNPNVQPAQPPDTAEANADSDNAENNGEENNGEQAQQDAQQEENGQTENEDGAQPQNGQVKSPEQILQELQQQQQQQGQQPGQQPGQPAVFPPGVTPVPRPQLQPPRSQ